MRSYLFFVVLLTAISISASVRTENGKAIFTYTDESAQSVSLAGDFNGWSETATPMSLGDNGVWSVEIDISPGRYEYKFIVDTRYTADPDNNEVSPDPYGGNNSLLIVDGIDEQPAAQAPSKDNKGNKTFEYYNPSARSVSIAGSFNSWSPDAHSLANDGQGSWTINIALKPGKYEYKFIVDGSWQPDPENPATAPDGYGGVNSIIEIGDDGKTLETGTDKITDRISNTFANSRVYIGGRYTAISESRLKPEEDPRLRLSEPRHRLESFIRIKISDDVTAWGGMNLDTHDADRIYEAPLSLDSAAIELHSGEISAQAYYNRSIGGLNDPLEILGSSRIAGSSQNEIPFGIGTGGVELRGQLAGFSLDAIYCDRFISNATIPHETSLLDDLGRIRHGLFREDVIDPIPNTELFTQYGTDVLGIGLSRDFGPLHLSGLLRRDSGTFWYSIAEMSIPYLDHWIDTSGSTSDWFALGNSEMLYGGYIKTTLGFLGMWGEYLQYNYRGGIHAGNRENDARDGNGPMDLELGNFDGRLAGGGIGIQPKTSIELQLNYRSQYLSPPTNEGIFFQPAPSTDGDGRVDLAEFNISPEIGSSWWESYSAEFRGEWFLTLSLGIAQENMRDRFSGDKRKTIRGSFDAECSILWDFIVWELNNELAFSQPSAGGSHDESRSNLLLRLAIANDWYFNLSTGYYRLMIKNIPDIEDIYTESWPVFTSIDFSPVENVRMELYWGVHPVMANGWPSGRREYIDKYIRENNATYSEALRELGEVRQIGIRGEVQF